MNNAIATPLVLPIARNDVDSRYQDQGTDAEPDDGDPHLRSALAVIGYHIEASDGEIGHVEDFLLDDDTWQIRYITVDTRNWLPGERVLLPVRAIREIDWFTKVMAVGIDREKVKDSPPYNPQMTSDGPFNDRSHQYFGLTLLDGDEMRKLKIGA